MANQRIAYLLKKRYNNTATISESKELAELINNSGFLDIDAVLQTIWDESDNSSSLTLVESEAILAQIIQNQTDTKKKVHILNTKAWLRYAAVALLIFSMAGATYLLYPKNEKASIAAEKFKGDVPAGKQGAKLKLADGKIILIESAKEGLIAIENGISIYKENRKIIYKGSSNRLVYNEIITDKGRQWSTILPDNSVVWLNANSSLKFPLQFSDHERLVELTGEASFKVVHNETKPFRVKAYGQLIEDIGTEFNVEAYSDELAIKTTLIEGSASVSTNNKKVILKSGQQSLVSFSSSNIEVSNGDIEAATAWRKGLFYFKDADLKAIMRQLSRWYDVEVKYEGDIQSTPDFSGKMDRSLTLAQTLKALSNLQVHFRIEEDKRIVILP